MGCCDKKFILDRLSRRLYAVLGSVRLKGLVYHFASRSLPARNPFERQTAQRPMQRRLGYDQRRRFGCTLD